jgi:hypothetical protein
MSWILTESGKRFDFRASDNPVDIRDIAGALSKMCRFTGHTNNFYSVATHCVLVSHLVPEHLAFEGLMHDAHEAYIGDVSSPLKSLLPDYQRIEAHVEAQVRFFFGLPITLDSAVKDADLLACTMERGLLLPEHPEWPIEGGVGFHHLIYGDGPKVARERFLRRFLELYSE